MSAIDAKFTAEDTRFLEKNFQVYDSLTKSCHTDFSVMRGCKVILLGEFHQSYIEHKIQNAFLKRFASASDCLLLEGFPSLQPFPHKDCLGLPNLPPNISIKGSDVRVNSKAVGELINYRALLFSYVQFKWEKILELRGLQRKIAEVINEELRSGKAGLENELLVLSPRAIEELDKVKEEVASVNHQLKEKHSRVPNLFGNTQLSLRESNLVLANCIIKIAEDLKIQKIFANWGFLHFVGKEELFDSLKKKGLSFCVLLPNQKRCQQVSEELGLEQKFSLDVLVKDRIRTYKYPLHMLKIFESSVQTACSLSSKKIWVTHQMIQEAGLVEVSPEQSLCFKMRLTEAMHEQFENGRIDLLGWLEPIFLETKRRFCFVQLNNPIKKLNSLIEECTEYLQIKSSLPIQIKVVDLIVTRPALLWKHMLEKRLFSYEVPANHPMVLKDITGDFSNLSSLLNSALDKDLPPGKDYELQGNITLSVFGDSQKPNALQLISAKGFQILLHNKP